jgi:hypothetical protein
LGIRQDPASIADAAGDIQNGSRWTHKPGCKPVPRHVIRPDPIQGRSHLALSLRGARPAEHSIDRGTEAAH